jgi:5-methylcytosine-specific restriction endonuclease McrA
VSQLLQNVDTSKLSAHRQAAKRISKKYSPRGIFNRWRDAEEGKTWKKAEFERIQGVCPVCGVTLPSIDFFHIDHIQPLCDRPDLAIELSNLRLVCSKCNLRKGAKKDDCW